MRAYLLEIENANGEMEQFELAVNQSCNAFRREDVKNDPRLAAVDLLDIARLEEYPDICLTAGDDWGERLGVYADLGECGNDGCGAIHGTTDEDAFGASRRFRVTKVEVSGRPTAGFARWLAEHPYVRWFAYDFWSTPHFGGTTRHVGETVTTIYSARFRVVMGVAEDCLLGGFVYKLLDPWTGEEEAVMDEEIFD